MRDLTAERNIAVVHDALAGEAHRIYFRRPTNAEMVAFQNSAFRRKGSKLENRLFETRLAFGAKIMTGFEKGSFGADGKPFASDPKDPDYRGDWADLIRENAPDVVAVVAMIAFEGATVGNLELLGAGEEADEEADPLREKE